MVSQTQPTLVAVIGIGLVGAEFVDQLLAQPRERFQIVSLSTSRVTLFNASGLDLSSNWRSVFQQTNAPTILSALLGELRALVEAGRKVVLVDNTSAENVANMYPNFLAAGVNVITPNKKAFSGEQKLFEDILAASEKSGARFLNESTVGAGLPIISTLKDLVGTGDEVIPCIFKSSSFICL